MKALGIVLVVLGIIGIVAGGITYTKQRHVLDVGPIQATVNEKERVPIPPVAGVISLAAGIVLLVAGSRRRTV